MSAHTLDNWRHNHDFALKNTQGEQHTTWVLWLTAATMLVEIVAGSLYGSMALLADGWHMSTHVAAFLITLFAYRYARQHAADPAYAFSTGKVNVLGSFVSAIVLAVVALVMMLESVQRLLLDSQNIQFDEAILIACLGLVINLMSAWLLQHDHQHAPEEEHNHDHDHAHEHDHNLQAAYLHVLADAMTSVLAIIALIAGKYLGWYWLDPVMGMVGALIITRWAYGLIQHTGPILLDAAMDAKNQLAIKTALEQEGDTWVTDLHIWRVSTHHYAAIIAVLTHQPNTVEHYKNLLRDFQQLTHLTIEVNPYPNIPNIQGHSK